MSLEVILIPSLVMFTYLFLILYYIGVKRGRRQKEKNKKLFLNTVLAALKIKRLSNLKDAKDLFNEVYEKPYNEETSYTLADNLNSLNAKLKTDHEIDEPTFQNYTTIINKILNEIESVNPYSELPEYESSILQNINTFFDNKCYDAVKNEVTNLASLMVKNQLIINKHVKTNKWSVPLAIIGIIFTIFFGTLALILSL